MGENRAIDLNCLTSRVVCDLCQKSFSRKSGLDKHIKLNRCYVIKQHKVHKHEEFEKNNIRLEQTISELMREMQYIKMQNQTHNEITQRKIDEINQRSQITNNQNLQVMCVNSNDNFLDILTKRSNYQEALTFIKDCALSRLAGDCRLLEKVYFSGNKPSIVAMNQARTHFVYYNENNQRILETNPKALARKLADCLQKTYLKGINYFQTDISERDERDYNHSLETPEQDINPQKINRIESYDAEDWNQHIHDLSTEKYQKKILDRLRIPFVNNF